MGDRNRLLDLLIASLLVLVWMFIFGITISMLDRLSLL